MSYRGTPGIECWTMMPVADRTVEVNTKTGFSLTAGSYAIHATSNQQGTIVLIATDLTENATISSVTTTRAACWLQGYTNNGDTGSTNTLTRVSLAAATTVTLQREGSAQAVTGGYVVEETY